MSRHVILHPEDGPPPMVLICDDDGARQETLSAIRRMMDAARDECFTAVQVPAIHLLGGGGLSSARALRDYVDTFDESHGAMFDAINAEMEHAKACLIRRFNDIYWRPILPSWMISLKSKTKRQRWWDRFSNVRAAKRAAELRRRRV